MNNIILRGDLYYADLNPVIGSEQGGTRPVLVIQNNTGNRHSPTVIVAAVTGKTKPKLPTHIALNGLSCLEQDSMVLLEQLRTIDKWRLGDYIGKINKALMEEVNHGLAVSIGLNHLISEPLTLCLCCVCADQFYSSPAHTIRRSDPNQFEKDTCMYCNVRKGYDFIIRKKR